jgi:hypothetical protein
MKYDYTIYIKSLLTILLVKISSWYQVFVTQLNETMIEPLNNFIDNEFDGRYRGCCNLQKPPVLILFTLQELYAQSEMFNMAGSEEEQVMMKYLKVPKKVDNEIQRQQSNEEVFLFKRKFHNVCKVPVSSALLHH